MRTPTRGATLAAALLLTSPAPALAHQGDTTLSRGNYRIDFTTEILAPRVQAELGVTTGRIFMAGWGADMHPRGWAYYIRNLRARELDGREVALTEVVDSAMWALADATPRVIRLEYQVDLSYATAPWPAGNEQAATLQGRDLFTVSKALFIVSAAPGARMVRFAVPSGWFATVPWAPAAGMTDAYLVSDTESLINNSLVVRPTAPAVIRAGSFTFLLATLGDARTDRDRVARALQGVVPEFVRVFPQTPPTRYLMTLFRSVERDAEAYSASAAFSEAGPLTDANRALWAGTLAHELFHAWNGLAIRPTTYADMQWLSEGFTDYYATRSLARTGVIDEPLFIRKMDHAMGLYLYFKAAPAFDGITLVAAGARKGRHRLGVYSGGWVVALCMDTAIRSQSNGAKSLDDVLRLLYARFGLTGRTYSLEDFKSVLAEVSPVPFDDFLTRYVVGNETIPVDECLQRAGYQGAGAGYDGEYYVARGGPSPYRTWLFGKD